MYQNRKQRLLLATGLLLVSGSNILFRLIFPVNEFVPGFCNGLGLVLIVASFYKSRYRA